ncbi:TPA: hypothetical protein ACOEHP_000725 [Enterobacter ludwigii]|nr:hypothetical protein [Enterobacter ludwigii]
MSTITKQWLQQKIAYMEAVRDEIPFGLDEDDSNTLAALRIALASLEAEPVAWLWSNRKHPREVTLVRPEDDELANPGLWSGWSYKALYAVPPAPEPMKDHQFRELVNELRDIAVEYHGTQQLRERIARTIRAAMLQGADGNSPVIPDWQAKAEKLAELHGSSFVVFRNGESPQCADPTKVIISFTDEGLGHGSAAPQQEVKL